MKQMIFALALLISGGASLSTASAASIAPVAATISEAARSDSALQLTGGPRRHFVRFYRRRGYFFYGRNFYNGNFEGYPYGYYNGFCYDHPYHWWCRRHFYHRY